MSGWQFPQWSYGYTQMPGYNYPYPGYHPPPPPRPPSSGRGGKVPSNAPVIKAEPVIKPDQTALAIPGPSGPSAPVKKEEGEIVEKSVLGILNGRNPVMFCNDQSKLRGLHMEWEQVSSQQGVGIVSLTFCF